MRHLLRIIIAAFLVVAASLEVSAQSTVRVTVDGASIWSAPSVPSMVLATVKVGTPLEVVAQVGSWYRVKLPADPTRTGYILARLVEGGPAGSGAPPGVPPASPGGTQARAPSRRQPRRSFLSGGAGYPPVTLQFDSKVSFTDFVEPGSRTTTYTTKRTVMYDVGYGIELHRGLFIAGAVSGYSGSTDAAIDEQVPHPFFFNQMRTLKATATDLPREETAIHIQVAGLMPISKHFHLFVAAGPSVFKLKQTLVTDVHYTQDYPYDSVTFQSAVTEFQQQTHAGANAQANLITMLSKHAGVDALVRFSYASMNFTASDGSKMKVPAGGLQVGVGLRAEF